MKSMSGNSLESSTECDVTNDMRCSTAVPGKASRHSSATAHVIGDVTLRQTHNLYRQVLATG